MKVLLLLSIGVLSFFMIGSPKNKSIEDSKIYSSYNHSIKKIKAFEILKMKCNICHVKQNRKKIFSLDNMDLFGSKIQRQVFEKKRMPKGKKITLTGSEIVTLKNWLKTLNIE